MRAQKSATTVEGMRGPRAAAASFRDDRPMAVVLERSSVEEGDIQLRREASLRELVKKLDATSGAKQKNKPAEQQAEEVERLMDTLVSSTIMELTAGFLEQAHHLGVLSRGTFGLYLIFFAGIAHAED